MARNRAANDGAEASELSWLRINACCVLSGASDVALLAPLGAARYQRSQAGVPSGRAPKRARSEPGAPGPDAPVWCSARTPER